MYFRAELTMIRSESEDGKRESAAVFTAVRVFLYGFVSPFVVSAKGFFVMVGRLYRNKVSTDSGR